MYGGFEYDSNVASIEHTEETVLDTNGQPPQLCYVGNHIRQKCLNHIKTMWIS